MKTNRSPRLFRRALAPAAMILVGLPSITACGPLFPDAVQNGDQSSQDPAVTQGSPAELRQFYTQQLTWSSCERTMRCAKVKVPMDYANPQGKSIELALVK